jgi:integrase
MQNGSLIRAERQTGPDVWEFRWRELAGNGKRTHRRIVLGSVDRLVDEAAARQAVSALCIDINAGDARVKANITTVSELTEHYRQRELRPDTVWKTYSTKVTYESYLKKWILPRWGSYPLVRVNAGEVELWLRSLTLARASCAKIRNLMSVVFNHGIRYQICDRNPIQLVRQSAKRKAVPVVLTPMEVQRLLSALALRERTLVLMAFGTGKKRFFALSPQLAERLRFYVEGRNPDEPLFLSTEGRRLHPDNFIKRQLKPILKKLGLDGAAHAFRHGNASLLDHLHAPMKVRQDRLGHADPRTTMGYTHVIGDDHRKVAEQLGEFFAQVRLNLPKYKNGSGEGRSQAVEV